MAGPDDEEGEDEESVLRAISGADASANSGQLLDLVYHELRRLADTYLSKERADHTLQPTALVHEAYVRLAEHAEWNDQSHFFATAARAMRNVLVDHARTKKRDKRGGSWNRVELDSDIGWQGVDSVDLVALDKALTELDELSPRRAEIIELRFFTGLSVEAVAKLLDVSEGTVARDWRFARAWLSKRLREE